MPTQRNTRKRRPRPAEATEPPANWPRQARLFSIEVYEEDIVLRRETDRGAERRLIEPADLRRLLAHCDRNDRQSTAWLPAGPGVEAVTHLRGRWRWLVRRPAGPATMIFETVSGKKARRRTIRFRCPSLLAELTGNPRKRGGVRWDDVVKVFAVPNGPLVASTPLHACPTPNVHRGNAHMCAVKMEAVEGLPPLAAFETAFFGSAFTEMIADALTPAAKTKHGSLIKILRTTGRIHLRQLRKEGTVGSLYSIS